MTSARLTILALYIINDIINSGESIFSDLQLSNLPPYSPMETPVAVGICSKSTPLVVNLLMTALFISLQWIPPENPKQKEADEQIAIDLGDEFEEALNDASQDEIIDLAGKQ